MKFCGLGLLIVTFSAHASCFDDFMKAPAFGSASKPSSCASSLTSTPMPSAETLRSRALYGAEITPADYSAARGNMSRAREIASQRASRELSSHRESWSRINRERPLPHRYLPHKN